MGALQMGQRTSSDGSAPTFQKERKYMHTLRRFFFSLFRFSIFDLLSDKFGLTSRYEFLRRILILISVVYVNTM